MSGQKTKKEILEEFVSQWDKVKKDTVLTIVEIGEYYKDVSATIDRDDYFELMVLNSWKFREVKDFRSSF